MTDKQTQLLVECIRSGQVAQEAVPHLVATVPGLAEAMQAATAKDI